MWSVCEYLLSVCNCLTVVSTHNHLLNNLSDTYYNTKLLEMDLNTHKCVFKADYDTDVNKKLDRNSGANFKSADEVGDNVT